MSSLTVESCVSALRRHGFLLAMSLLATVLLAISARASTSIPLPDPFVVVKTTSGSVVRTTIVPMGGVPVPIDVDDGGLAGLLKPDMTAEVGLTTLHDLPRKGLVPNITFRRSLLAVATGRPAPPVKVEATVRVLDLAQGLKTMATVTYGYSTPPGQRMPPLVRARLLGPLTEGFIDPLDVEIETPGYGGALDIHAKVTAGGLDGRFDIGLDPMPERLRFVQDPREDGFDAHYEHSSTVEDVHLQAKATIRSGDGPKQQIGAQIERLPGDVDLRYTGTDDTTTVEYAAKSALGKPDVRATYTARAADGTVLTDATIAAAGVPTHLRGIVENDPGAGGGQLRSADVTAFGDEIGAVDFVAGNGGGSAVPVIELGPKPFVAFAQRVVGGRPVYRASGRIERVRSVHVERDGDDLDLRTSIGGGQRPLRLRLDSDDRPSGGMAVAVDATLSPLPSAARVRLEPGHAGSSEPTHIRYEASAPLDADASIRTAAGPATACGEAAVTCVEAAVDDVPARLAIDLPSGTGTDFSLSHDGTGVRPDVRATVEQVGKDAGDSTWLRVGLDDVPPEVRGRVDSSGNVLRAAEFHACDWDFTSEVCHGAPLDELGAVRFTVRDQRTRAATLPPLPDVATTHVAVLRRGSQLEASGHLEAFREAVFRQRAAGGPLGVRLDMGNKKPFDIALDDSAAGTATKLTVHVDALPQRMSACVRPPVEAAPPRAGAADSLLGACERTDVLGYESGELPTTPLSLGYRASSPMKVDARLESRADDPADGGRPAVTVLDTSIDRVPAQVRADVIPPLDAQGQTPARKLQIAYDADDNDSATDDEISAIDVDLQSRRAASSCADARRNQRAVCLHARVTDIPGRMALSYDPDQRDGGLELTSSAAGMDVRDLALTLVQPGDDGGYMGLSGDILGLPTHLTGRISRVTDEDGREHLGAVTFDPCDRAGDCGDVDHVVFTASNARNGAGLPSTPALDPPLAGVDEQLTFVQRGDLFRAHGDIRNLRSAGLTMLDGHGKPSPTTQIDAAFGDPGSKLRARIDTDDGSSSTLMDAVISKAPEELHLCLRPPVDAELVQPDSKVWCDRQLPADSAIMAKVAESSSARPDIDVRELRVASLGGAKLLTGALSVKGLGKRLEVLSGKDGDIRFAGRTPDGGQGADAAARVSFDLRSFDGPAPTSGFPWVSTEEDEASADHRSIDPDADPRNQDADGKANFVKLLSNYGHTRIAGSVPGIRSIAMHPGACEADEDRYRSGAQAYTDAQRPDVQCVRAGVAAGHPLGVAVRTQRERGQRMALEDVQVSSMPADGLEATVASSPAAIRDEPVCAAGVPLPCRPPLLSIRAHRGAGQAPVLEGRLAVGEKAPLAHLLTKADPRDAVSARLDYDQVPRMWADRHNGARLKIGSNWGEGTALRASLRLPLPPRLDVDPPTTFSDEDKAAHQLTSDTFLRIVAEDEDAKGDPQDLGGYLGRVAVLAHDFATHDQVIVTGAPPAPKGDGVAGTPDAPGGVPHGDFDEGFLLPAHTDVRIYSRDHASEAKDVNQRSYLQVDGRVSDALDVALRINAREQGITRSGATVPSTSLALHGAPGRAAGQGYEAPSFRVRAQIEHPSRYEEIKAAADAASKPPATPDGDRCHTSFGDGGPVAEGLGYSAREAGFGIDACLFLPSPKARWLDVSLDANPDGPGGNAPARTIDAVVRLDGSSNEAEIEGYEGVDSAYGSQGNPAPIDASAALRLEPFDLGFRLGGGVGLAGGSLELLDRSDLVVHVRGDALDRLRLAQSLGALSLDDPAFGLASLSTDMISKARLRIRNEAFFGAIDQTTDIRVPDPPTGPGFPQNVYLNRCFTPETFTDKVEVGPDTSATLFALTLGIPEGGPEVQALAGPFSILSNIAGGVWCGLSGKFVPGGVPLSWGVDALPAPSPAYATPQRPIENAAAPIAGPPADLKPALGGDPPGDELVASGTTKTLCGSVEYRNLVVEDGGTLKVGAPGAKQSFTVPTASGDIVRHAVCDGTLSIAARNVDVQAGGAIDAAALIAERGKGSPSAPGAGAGGYGAGGAGGAGGATPGGARYGALNAYAPLAGSPAAGAVSGSGGLGGGALRIDAKDMIRVAGHIGATGSAGAAGACGAAGGGGSGGAIELSANRIFVVGGVVSVHGGLGGDGGGGGGGGGRIALRSVRQEVGQGGTISAGAGVGGAAGAGCGPGGDAEAGSAELGEDINMAAGVRRPGAQAAAAYAEDGQLTLRLDAVADQTPQAHDVQVVVCARRLAPAGDVSTLDSPALDPFGASNPSLLMADAACTSYEMYPAGTPGAASFPDGYTPFGDEYARNVSHQLTEGDGYYGIYAFAARANGPGVPPGFSCATVASIPKCEYQDHLPTRSTVRVMVDHAPPTVTVATVHGEAGCAGDPALYCASGESEVLKVTAHDALTGDVDTASCQVSTLAEAVPCGPGEVSVPIGSTEGIRTITARANDPAGNTGSSLSQPLTLLLDTQRPGVTAVAVDYLDAAHNGWHKKVPEISAHAVDPKGSNPDDPRSSGFGADPLGIDVDGVRFPCAGGVQPTDVGVKTSCDSGEAATFAEAFGHGVHTLLARAADRAGNAGESPTEAVVRVDSRPPTAELAMVPVKPDGGDNWYVTRPYVVLSAHDVVGGSGVDPSKPGSGVYYRIDGEVQEHRFDPASRVGVQLDDGIHTVCWRAVDVAGNASKNQCSGSIKVDAKAPAASDGFTPATPDGGDGFHRTTPSITPSGADAKTVVAGDDAASGLRSIQYRLDSGGWQAAGAKTFKVPEGRHVTEVRATDKAGNVSAYAREDVAVDTIAPTVEAGSYPPAPNARGWFRAPVRLAIAGEDNRGGSGLGAVTAGTSGQLPLPYAMPLVIGEGHTTAAFAAADRATNGSGQQQLSREVDLTAPVTAPGPIALPALLLPAGKVTLPFQAGDDRSPRVRVRLEILDELGQTWRRLPAPAAGGDPWRPVGAGAVTWDGRLPGGETVQPGLYHYRVVAVDEAGNATSSTESRAFTVLAPVTPLALKLPGVAGTLSLFGISLKLLP